MAVVVLSGCGLLDVENPNELVEVAVQQLSSAAGLANGAEALVADAVSQVWQAPEIASDNMFWVGSRDAWGSLDNGFLDDPFNEFVDGAFPSLGTANWMVQTAVVLLLGHVADNPDFEDIDGLKKDLARAQMFKGISLMVTAEIQADMTFSDKMDSGPPVSTGGAMIGSDAVATMDAVMGVAIASLTDAIAGFAALGENDLETRATAVRARAHSSRAIMAARTSVGGALSWPLAFADANTVLSSVGGSDWTYNFAYSAGTVSCDMCGWINERKENTWDRSLVTLDADKDITGISMSDPVSGADDKALIHALEQWKQGAVTASGNEFNDLTVVSERLLWSIVAEHELEAAGGVVGGSNFDDAINEIRALDNEPDFVSGAATHGLTDLEFLQHTRRMASLAMGLRLQDMFRWGLAPGAASDGAALWSALSTAVLAPGTMLPITIIEIRANCHLNGQDCPSGG